MEAKRGRPKNIESPAKLWELFEAYKVSVKFKPILVQDFVGAMATEVRREKERPLTMEGFENYCADQDIIEELGDYFSNKGGRYADFAAICSRVRRSIRQDQIEGGMAGIYNPSITQRLNGLVDKKEDSGEVSVLVTYATKANNISGATPEPTKGTE
jgi:DNA-packaging protein gp3